MIKKELRKKKIAKYLSEVLTEYDIEQQELKVDTIKEAMRCNKK